MDFTETGADKVLKYLKTMRIVFSIGILITLASVLLLFILAIRG